MRRSSSVGSGKGGGLNLDRRAGMAAANKLSALPSFGAKYDKIWTENSLAKQKRNTK
jgi:hypothetical protein